MAPDNEFACAETNIWTNWYRLQATGKCSAENGGANFAPGYGLSPVRPGPAVSISGPGEGQAGRRGRRCQAGDSRLRRLSRDDPGAGRRVHDGVAAKRAGPQPR